MRFCSSDSWNWLNDWTDKETGKIWIGTTDETVNVLGIEAKKIGQHSPRNLWSTTITDQVRIATNFRSKVGMFPQEKDRFVFTNRT